jgi:Protein of Unknown function (DUF2784)
MSSGHLADLVVGFHAAFVAFAALGGVLCLRWPRAAWAHLPCALWGVVVELTGWVCPLTPLEVHLRRLAGEAGYSGGFIQHYITPVLYPEGLTRADQWVLALTLLAFNAAVYAVVWRRWRRRVSMEHCKGS